MGGNKWAGTSGREQMGGKSSENEFIVMNGENKGWGGGGQNMGL